MEIYPHGYFTSFTITPGLILASVMLVFLIRDIVNGRIKGLKIKPYDIILTLLFLWQIVSDYFGSKVPGFSLIFSIVNLNLLILYFYIRIYVTKREQFVHFLLSIVSALIVFESFISFQQYLAKSPLGKTIEAQVNIEYFGHAVDELQFTFRPLGTFVHANALGIWLSSYLIILLIIPLFSPISFPISIIVLGLISLIMTLSRSSWLGFFIGVVAELFIMEKLNKIKVSNKINRYISFFVLLSIPLFIFFVLPRAEKSAFTFSQGGGYYRSVQIQKSLQIIIKNPVFGVGSQRSVQEGLQLIANNKLNSSILLDVHNWYVINIIEHGLPFILIFLLLIILYFKKLINTKFPVIWKVGFFCGIISTLVAGFFQPFLNLQIIIISLALL